MSDGFSKHSNVPSASGQFTLCIVSALCVCNTVCRLTIKCKSQVFFRAGVLGQMEELRDDRLAKIITWLQAWIRGFISRKEYKKLQEQR